jgi:hypothetical protein
MPISLQQTANAISAAVNHLQVQGVKPGSQRASLSTVELQGSAGAVHHYIVDHIARERDEIATTVAATADALKAAEAAAKAAGVAIRAAGGKSEAALATMEAAKASGPISRQGRGARCR